MESTTYHIYAKDRVLYCNLEEEEFEEKWELLEVMIDLLGGDYSKDDISYIKLGPKCCLLYTSPSPRDGLLSRMPSSA